MSWCLPIVTFSKFFAWKIVGSKFWCCLSSLQDWCLLVKVEIACAEFGTQFRLLIQQMKWKCKCHVCYLIKVEILMLCIGYSSHIVFNLKYVTTNMQVNFPKCYFTTILGGESLAWFRVLQSWIMTILLVAILYAAPTNAYVSSGVVTMQWNWNFLIQMYIIKTNLIMWPLHFMGFKGIVACADFLSYLFRTSRKINIGSFIITINILHCIY